MIRLILKGHSWDLLHPVTKRTKLFFVPRRRWLLDEERQSVFLAFCVARRARTNGHCTQLRPIGMEKESEGERWLILHRNRTRGLYMGNESAQQIAKFVQLNWDLVSEVQLVNQEDKIICMQIMDNWCHIYCKIGVPSTIQRARPRIQFQFHLEGRCRGEHKFFAYLLISTCKDFDTRQSLEKELSMQPSLHVAWSTSRDSPSSLRPLLFCLGSMIDS